MNPLRTAHNVRIQLAGRWILQLTVAFALLATALFSGSNKGAVGLIVCMIGAGAFIYFGLKNYRAFKNLGDFSRAQTVQRQEIKDLKRAGWVQARQRKLPESCRGSVVMFTPEGDLAFVIGLSGYWPVRESLAEPQRVSELLEQSGTPHIPVCLAAFVTGAEESFNYGVLAVSPSRFASALTEAVDSFREKQDRAFTGLVDRFAESQLNTTGSEVVA